MAPKGLLLLLLLAVASSSSGLPEDQDLRRRRRVMEVEGGPESVVWVVQLSDLHFSIFHPERAYDFSRYVGPALAMIRPSLVLITGDLTDGKSKDLLTMKQNEAEWIEYQNVIDDVIKRSGLDKEIFFDVRGNHDSFGVPEAGGTYDYYSKYSINARLGRKGNVQSITLQNNRWKHLFVGFDSTMEIGLRGPTNLFGHPNDQLLADLDTELSQWDVESQEFALTKVSFGHFPLSFTASTDGGKGLKDVFLKHSVSAYICGHLHTRFGPNLKRHHQSDLSTKFYQYNIHQGSPNGWGDENCSSKPDPTQEFWEWEMGDWRRSRAMRVLAIDAGLVSYVDVDFRLGSKETIILPTFPLDSRFMQRLPFFRDYRCQTTRTSSCDMIRTLVFSRTEIVLVSVKVYDVQPGTPTVVIDSAMKRVDGNGSRGDIFVAPWNWRAFVDPSPDRYWIQIEVVDISGKSSYSQIRPFSLGGFQSKVSWRWKEFFVMGIQWASIYHPALWSVFSLLFALLLIPRFTRPFWKNYCSYKFVRPKSCGKRIRDFLVYGAVWTLMEISSMTVLWSGILIYLLYLLTFPWFYGHVFTEKGDMAYMTYKGWFILNPDKGTKAEYVGVPDVMVVVLPHLYFVVLPTILVIGAMAAEQTAYRMYCLSLSGKKEDDIFKDDNRNANNTTPGWRWTRKFFLLIVLIIMWKHWKQCRALVKAYEMNPFCDSPIYCFMIPVALIYAIYRTKSI